MATATNALASSIIPPHRLSPASCRVTRQRRLKTTLTEGPPIKYQDNILSKIIVSWFHHILQYFMIIFHSGSLSKFIPEVIFFLFLVSDSLVTHLVFCFLSMEWYCMNPGDLSAPPTFLFHASISYMEHLLDWCLMSCVMHIRASLWAFWPFRAENGVEISP